MRSAAQIAESLFRYSPQAQKALCRLEIRLNRFQSLMWTRGDVDSPRLINAMSVRNAGGRPPQTRDMADFAQERKHRNTWKEIAVEWAALFPVDRRTVGRTLQRRQEILRDAWRRFYGDKKRAKPQAIFNPPRTRR